MTTETQNDGRDSNMNAKRCSPPVSKLQAVAEDVAIRPSLNVTAETEFQLRPVEWRLLELLFRVREGLDLEHDKGVTRRVRGRDRGELAFDRFDAAEFKYTIEPHRSRHPCIVIVVKV